MIPTGGYGMNTGIADATDLGWKVGALVNGWGGPKLLASYEAERRPIALQNRAMAQRHYEVRFAIASLIAQEKGGDLTALGAKVAALGNLENECWGPEHGYCFVDSPIIAREVDAAPRFDPAKCVPSTYPESRLPHLYLADGAAL